MSTTTFGEARTSREKRVDARILDRVKAGIALLEEKHGPDWVEHVDLTTLNLGSGRFCVLGQVYGDYEYGLACTGIDQLDGEESTEAIAHGFERPDNGDYNYGDLQKVWERVLTPLVRT